MKIAADFTKNVHLRWILKEKMIAQKEAVSGVDSNTY